MKRVMLLLLLPSLAWAAPPVRGVNELGTAGASVAVSTSTKVLPGDPNRVAYCIVPEDGDIRCTFGGIDDSAASPTPTTTVGYFIPTKTYFCESRSPGGVSWSSLVVEKRLQCASTSGTVHVDSLTEP